MSYAAELSALVEKFATEWAASEATLVIYPNDVRTPPNDEFVTFSLAHGRSFIAEIGKDLARHDYPGVVTISCYVPLDIGTLRAYELADSAADIFRRLPIDSLGITFESPYIQDVGEVEFRGIDTKHYRVDCKTEFLRRTQELAGS